MSYMAYVIEETMHAKQADVARQAQGYLTRAAGRATRPAAGGRTWPSLFSRARATTAPPCTQVADVAGGC